MKKVSNFTKLSLFFLLIVIQLIYFRNYLFPLNEGVVIQPQWCTCPDMRVINGTSYLKKRTPGYIKKYNPDYSEVYIQNPVRSMELPNGAKQYFVQGTVVGLNQVDKKARWNPVLKLSYTEELLFFKRTLPLTLIGIEIELLMLGWIFRKKKIIQQ